MMKPTPRTRLIVIAAALGLLLAATAEASGPYYKTSTAARVTRKFTRGVFNVALGFVEIPKAINEDARKVDWFTGFWTGLCKGTGRMLERAGVGVYEIISFPVPCPEKYEPIILPEFVMFDEKFTWRDNVPGVDELK